MKVKDFKVFCFANEDIARVIVRVDFAAYKKYESTPSQSAWVQFLNDEEMDEYELDKSFAIAIVNRNGKLTLEISTLSNA